MICLPKKRVLVTDASERQTLAIIRSLGRKGIEVTAAGNSELNAGFFSKYCAKRLVYPDPIKNKRKFIDAMLSLVKREKFDLLIPTSDYTATPISERKEDFQKYVAVSIPSYSTLLKTLDKSLTIPIAVNCGVPCPKTYVVNDIDELRKIIDEFRYPVVIKPRTKVVWVNDQAIVMKVTDKSYASNKLDLLTKYKEFFNKLKKHHAERYSPLIQECIIGEGCGVEVLIHQSTPKAVFMHRRLREYPISGGASTLRESIKDEKIIDLAVRLLKALDWEGVAMVEFKIDKLNSEAKLLEVNGRFWGSLALAITAGIDFPFLLYQSIFGEDFSPPKYQTGVKQKCAIPGDLLWLFSSITSSRRGISAFKEFLSTLTVPDDIIEKDDPAPSIGALMDTSKNLLEVLTRQRTIAGESVL